MRTPIFKKSIPLIAMLTLAMGGTFNSVYNAQSEKHSHKLFRGIASADSEAVPSVVNNTVNAVSINIITIYHNTAELQAKQAEIDRLVKEHNDRGQRLVELNTRLEQVERDLAAEKVRADQAGGDLSVERARLEEERKKFVEDKKLLEYQIVAQASANQTLLAQVDTLRAEGDAKTANIVKLESEKSELEKAKVDIERQLAEAGTANAALLAEKAKVDAELETTKKALADETLARTQLASERDTLIQSLSVSDASLKEKIKALEESLVANTELRAKLELTEKDLAEARINIADLTRKIDALNLVIAEKDKTIADRDRTIAQNAADRQILVQDMCKQKKDLEKLGLDVQTLIQDKEKVLAEIKAKDEIINGKDAEFKKKQEEAELKHKAELAQVQEEFERSMTGMTTMFRYMMMQTMGMGQMGGMGMGGNMMMTNPLNSGGADNQFMMQLLMSQLLMNRSGGNSFGGFSPGGYYSVPGPSPYLGEQIAPYFGDYYTGVQNGFGNRHQGGSAFYQFGS